VPPVSAGRALARGLRKRCPRCGEPAIFRSWLQLLDRCPRCDLRFEKEEGGFLGAMTLTYALAMAIWVAMLVAVLIATVPELPVAPLIVASVAIMVAVPLLTYPNMKGVWAAIEYLVARSQPDYRPPVRRDPRAKDLE
jgi:uncharacterized protein (DUF983 family)